MSVIETKEFKDSLHCLDCAYEDLGYNGQMLCLPRTSGCRPVFPYDMMMKSRIRKINLLTNQATRKEDYDESKLTGIKLMRKD